MDVSVLLRCWNLLGRRTYKPTLIPLQELCREGREKDRRRIVLSQHSCISPQPKKGQKYPSIPFPPTCGQHQPRYKSDRAAGVVRWGRHAAMYPTGKFSCKTVELHKDDCLSLLQHFQGRSKAKIIAGDQIFGNGSTLNFI